MDAFYRLSGKVDTGIYYALSSIISLGKLHIAKINFKMITFYSYFNPFKATNDIICILFQPIKEDDTKFDRIKDVDEDPGTSTLLNTIIESFI